MIDKATLELLAMIVLERAECPSGVLRAAGALQAEIALIDVPDHVCPLCGQAKQQTALLELLGSFKSIELWGDDGQSWTIDVSACDGDLDRIVGLMLSVKRGEYVQ